MTASLHYHKLALASDSEAAALVNLWIALEALTRFGSGSSIDRVCRSVVPAICIENPRHVLTGIAVDVRRVWYAKDTSEYLALLSESTKSRLSPLDLLHTLRDVEDGPLITALYELIGDHVLMRFRTHRYRRGPFSTTNALVGLVQEHAQNVEWQLRRIYRARNNIVHRGEKHILTWNLVRHLHSYLVRFLNAILATMTHHRGWTIEAAVEHRRQIYTLFGQFGRKDDVITREAVLEPHLIAQSDTVRTTW